MLALRRWSVRHAAFQARAYRMLLATLAALRPVFAALGYARVEKPMAWIESSVKGLFFDCHMCGYCLLSVNGMACPMNCPKSLRNGPCGGVRADGGCEVTPEMPCVWIEANNGAARMRAGALPTKPNPPLEHQYTGRSSWLRVLRQEPWPAALVTQAPPRSDDAPTASRLPPTKWLPQRISACWNVPVRWCFCYKRKSRKNTPESCRKKARSLSLANKVMQKWTGWWDRLAAMLLWLKSCKIWIILVFRAGLSHFFPKPPRIRRNT